MKPEDAKRLVVDALSAAYHHGARTADGYRDGLCSMHSRRTLGAGDDHADKIRSVWFNELREKLATELLEKLASEEIQA